MFSETHDKITRFAGLYLKYPKETINMLSYYVQLPDYLDKSVYRVFNHGFIPYARVGYAPDRIGQLLRIPNQRKLGFSLHYFQDLSQPSHTTFNQNYHQDIEKRIEDKFFEYLKDFKPNPVKIKNPKSDAIRLAKNSHSVAKKLIENFGKENWIMVDNILKDRLRTSVNYTIGALKYNKSSKLLTEKILFPLRFKYLTNILLPYLKGDKVILDIGSSCGRLAKNIQDKLNREPNEFGKCLIIGVDKVIQPKTYIPIKECDAKNLPFRNNSFDSVMLIDVLHHSNNPEKIMREAKRASKKHILIKDHYWENKKDLTALKYADDIGNINYGIDLPYNFLNMKSWGNLIRDNNLALVGAEKFRYNFLDPLKHIIFYLEK